MDLLEKAWEGRVEFESFEHYVFEVTTQYAPLEITVEAIDDGVSTHRSVPHLYVSTCSELSTQRPSVRSALPRANYEAPFADKRTPSTQYSAMGIVRRPGESRWHLWKGLTPHPALWPCRVRANTPPAPLSPPASLSNNTNRQRQAP